MRSARAGREACGSADGALAGRIIKRMNFGKANRETPDASLR